MAALARVLQSPESLHIIYQLSDRLEQLTLLRVSQPFFNVGAAIIWEKVEGVHNLLVLSPGVSCTDRAGEPKAKTIAIPTLPMDMTRFNKYAPFVKNLEIYDKDTEKYWIPNWRGFGTNAKNEILLPNLKTLTLTTTLGCSTSQIMWIRAFVAPSLISIEATYSAKYAPLISYRSASALLRYIAEACPNIQTLSIFPDSNPRPTIEYGLEMHDEQAMLDFWDSSLAPYLKRLRSLSELAATTEILSPDCLVHLSSMPKLSCLTIYPTATPFRTVGPMSAGRTAGFKAFTQFKLFSATPALVENIWRLKIFGNLTSLELDSVTPSAGANDTEHHTSATAILSNVAKNSPYLSNLVINFDTSIIEKRHYDLGSLSVLHPLRTLPLKELCLRGVRFNVVPPPRSLWTIGDYLRRVVKLELPNKLCSLKQLYELSRLSKLEYLIVILELRTPQADSPSPVIKNSNFRVLESSRDVNVDGDVHAIASYLLLLWPKLQSVKWAARTERKKDAVSSAVTISTALNGSLLLLRELNEVKEELKDIKESVTSGPSRPRPNLPRRRTIYDKMCNF
ncbi:hypothetical protein BDV93DRAFT_526903 [Ceratobasidium sp. AG-I]|nr:hypothetical protein BDV93DRAFT_526903 [Ceratobasidium sp. AG-I]